MKRKLISIVLALAMVLSLSVNTAMAAPGTPTFRISQTTARPGSTVDVTVAVEHNPGIASVKLKVAFPGGLTLNSVTYNGAIGGQSQEPQKLTSPVTLNWINGTANSTGDWVFATLSFTVASNAAPGSYPVTATYDPDDVYNISEDNVNFQVIAGGVTVSDKAGVQISVGNGAARAGETLSVPVRVAGNGGLAGVALSVQSDSALVLTGISKGLLLQNAADGLFTPNVGEKIITWFAPRNVAGDGELLLLTFRVAEGAADGTYHVAVTTANGLEADCVDEQHAPVTPTFSAGQVTVQSTLRSIKLETTGQGSGAMRVELLNSEGDSLQAAHGGENAALTGVTTGSYQVKVSQSGCVPRTVQVEVGAASEDVQLGEVELVKVGNVNGSKSQAGDDVSTEDMQCLFTQLSTGVNEGQIEDQTYFQKVCDVNNDDVVNILDYQALYEIVRNQ